MGNYNDNIGLSNFSSMPKEQYYDKYTTTDASSCGESCKGHALGETNNRWYEDYTGFVFSQYPWFLRGGYSGDANVAGVFNFYSGNVYGNIFSNFSFRVVLATTK